MSADNSVARSSREVDAPTERLGFEIPPELASRYEVRSIETPDGGERRVGLFLAGDRQSPAIEITDDRLVARNEDPETVASLVKIAGHNGWNRIDVEGSPEFRKAVWSAASREGLTVSGYEPTFAEQELMGERRRGATELQDRDPVLPTSVEQAKPADASVSAPTARPEPDRPDGDLTRGGSGTELSDGDRRLLLTLSRHTEDRKALYENLGPEMDAFQRDVQFERIDVNRDALDGALERVLESPTLVKAFERAGYEPDALRQMGKGGGWDGEVADAIYVVRSGLNRHDLSKGADAGAQSIGDHDAARGELSPTTSTVAKDRNPGADPPPTPADRTPGEAPERHHESEKLAELFLSGAADRVAAEPRLANALQAQSAMEQHIGEVFDGDASSVASAALESRQMISDVLRRGLDVSVREPTPVRQLEPVQTHHDLER